MERARARLRAVRVRASPAHIRRLRGYACGQAKRKGKMAGSRLALASWRCRRASLPPSVWRPGHVWGFPVGPRRYATTIAPRCCLRLPRRWRATREAHSRRLWLRCRPRARMARRVRRRRQRAPLRGRTWLIPVRTTGDRRSWLCRIADVMPLSARPRRRRAPWTRRRTRWRRRRNRWPRWLRRAKRRLQP